MKRIVIVLLSAVSIVSSVNAETLYIGTAEKNSDYLSMGKDISKYCSNTINVNLDINESGGSVDNLFGILDKRFDIGIVQDDVLNFYAMQTPNKINKNRIKAITGLHEEAVHLLIPKGYNPDGTNKKEGKWDNLFNKKDNKPKTFSLSMLKHHKVGATSTDFVSAEILSYFFDLDLEVHEAPMAVNDTSMPMIFVGVAPYFPVESYLKTGKWELATLDYKAVQQTAGFYNDQQVSYSVNGRLKTIHTIGVRALLIAKSFRKESRNESMSALATCIFDNIEDLADAHETSANWGNVYDYIEDAGQTNWSYFPLL